MSFALLAAVAAGCGSSASSSPAGTARHPAGGSGAGVPATTTSSSVGALSGEANSAATGDIPDNQVFLSYRSPAAGYSISYPEGWTRKGTPSDLTFSDKNNIVHIVIAPARAPSRASVTAELNQLKRSQPTLTFTAPKEIRLKGGPAIKVTYTTVSAPNAVTGKRVLLVVDRYELSQANQRATIDLGTPKGVDNVDAYRLMANSFRWL